MALDKSFDPKAVESRWYAVELNYSNAAPVELRYSIQGNGSNTPVGGIDQVDDRRVAAHDITRNHQNVRPLGAGRDLTGQSAGSSGDAAGPLRTDPSAPKRDP